MRIRIPVLAAVVAAVASVGSVANADIIMSSVRVANVNLPGYDSVQFFARNDGQANTSTATNVFKIGVVGLTLTDNTGSNMILGMLTDGGGTFLADPDGSSQGSGLNGDFSTGASGTDLVPKYGTSTYPADGSTATGGHQLYSWIGNGRQNTTGSYGAVSLNPDPGSTATTDSASNPAYNPVSSFDVTSAWTGFLLAGPTNGLNAKGGAYTGLGAYIAVAVVPHNDSVTLAGGIGGDAGDIFNVSITNSVGAPPVPEPASLGVLALGGLALLARRRKVA